MPPETTGKNMATRMWTKKDRKAQATKQMPIRMIVTMSWNQYVKYSVGLDSIVLKDLPGLTKEEAEDVFGTKLLRSEQKSSKHAFHNKQ
jgi:hypothetical protein